MWDYPWRESAFEKFRDYIKNNSKIVELLKKVKFKYFLKLKKKHGATHRVNSNLYENFNYINYYQAKKMHYNKFPNELWNYSIKKLLSQFEKRLEVLDFYIINYELMRGFITQINYDGLSN